ncbi:MAG TPA: ATP-binding protein [Macellibacteroides fermentans]|uniref:ATP-binding protein n=1 Tax=Macellibacteroides fermentans TaxID=879969 RepID=UPI002C05C6AD|nr:ATP-binding protein [Macellibacteroides fermentans]
MKRKLTTNSRLVNELFANYISTFAAFCELINNSLQAKAKNIWINIDYTNSSEIHPLVIKKIIIKDDGIGVHINDLDSKLLDIGTANKEGGKGIGRFAAFQIGRKIEIETVGYSSEDKTYSKAIIPLNFDSFGRNINVTDINLETKEEILPNNQNTYYQVTVSDLYDNTVTDNEPKKKIIDKFLQKNIEDAIFERYPLKIFNKEIKIHINGKLILPTDFVIGNPTNKIISYEDKKRKEHKIRFSFMQIKNIDKRKVFLTILNAGIHTIATGFEYEAEWLSPKIGGWFIYISCDTLPSDMYRNVDLDGMDEDVKHYKSFIKNQLNEFFKQKNKEFDNFIDKLKKDEYYPYKESSSSRSKVMVFDKLAFLVEDKYNLLNEKNKLREIIYPLIDRTISNGEFNQILRSILKLSNNMVHQFSSLLERTELDDIIEFSDKVSHKLEEIEFIEKIVYSEISKNVKERKELHKFLEKMLWIFGEEYNDSTRLLSDKSLENNLRQLRNELLDYKVSKKDDNINDVEKTIRSITDLFMYNEKIIDIKYREILVVELKAPRVKISPKELQQVMKYATEIEKSSFTPSNVRFKILLISSEINEDATFQIKGEEENPYIFFRNKKGNIEIWVMKWADIIENVKRKLKYMSAILEIKDVDVQEKAIKDFEEINFGRTSSSLKKVAI